MRRDALRRGCDYHELTRDDYRWMWAAYKFGSFANLIEEGLDEDGFVIAITSIMEEYYLRSGTAIVPTAYFGGRREMAPVGLVLVDYSQDAFWPHVLWFEWATPRNRIECAVKFLMELKEQGNLLILAEKKDIPFFSHLARYAILNRRCLLKKYFDDGDAVLYQGVKK